MAGELGRLYGRFHQQAVNLPLMRFSSVFFLPLLVACLASDAPGSPEGSAGLPTTTIATDTSTPDTSEPPTGWIDVATQGGLACGLTADREVVCFGSADSIDGTAPSSKQAADIDLGGYSGCLLDVDGYAECWGCQLSTSVFCTPPSEPLYGLRSANEGSSFCAFRQQDHALVCWGNYALVHSDPIGSFELDVATVAVVPPEGGTINWYPEDGPHRPPNDFQALDVSISRTHSCALDLDGMATCWGRNIDFTPFPQPDDPGPYVAIDSANFYVCATRADGSAHCWADPGYVEEYPSLLDTRDEPFRSVVVSTAHACGLRHDGSVRCWGATGGLLGEWTDASLY